MNGELSIMSRLNDTICAPATVRGKSALGIVRLCGPKAMDIMNRIFAASDGRKNFKSGKMYHGNIMDSKGQVLDDVMCVMFLAPDTYTGEDLVEVNHHGSIYIQQQIVLSMINYGARMAMAGEFTQRAFLNGKMGLMQAEAIADLIDAGTASAHKLAMQQMRGGYKAQLREIRDKLVKILGLLELELDFTEEDVEFADRKDLQALMQTAGEELEVLIKSFAAGDAFKNGVPIAIIGKPNSGKSTIMNKLLGEERSIVSPIKGTTRDTVEECKMFNGVEFRFIDTAGLRTTDDPIEVKGVERSFKAIERAYIIIYVCDLTDIGIEEVRVELQLLDSQISLKDKHVIIVGNKTDLARSTKTKKRNWMGVKAIMTSATNGIGIEDLVTRIEAIAETTQQTNEVLVSNSRHYEAMKRTLAALTTASESLANNQPTDIIAADVREATNALGEITGEVTNDEILSNIFSKFCIGK